MGAYEGALLASGRVDSRLKALASIKASALIGSAVGRELGVTAEQIRDLPRYRESPAFSEEERLALDIVVEMAKIPVEPPPELLECLRQRFDEAQLVELAAAISWESYRARFNRVFGVRPVGFCDGDLCALPEP